MRCVTLTSLASLALPYLSTFFHKRHESSKNKCVFRCLLLLLSETFLVPKQFSEIVWQMWERLHVKYRYSCHVLIKLHFCRHILDKSSNTKFYRNPFMWEPHCSLRTEERTDAWKVITKLIFSFRNFAKAPKNLLCLPVIEPHFLCFPARSPVIVPTALPVLKIQMLRGFIRSPLFGSSLNL
jgi:hypothetical protein